jgi:hypothetical protein
MFWNGSTAIDGLSGRASAAREMAMPPGSATPSMRVATFTPSPIRSSPWTTTSPRWTPIRSASAPSRFGPLDG